MERSSVNRENWDKNNIKWKHGYIESKAYKKIEERYKNYKLL